MRVYMLWVTDREDDGRWVWIGAEKIEDRFSVLQHHGDHFEHTLISNPDSTIQKKIKLTPM